MYRSVSSASLAWKSACSLKSSDNAPVAPPPGSLLTLMMFPLPARRADAANALPVSHRIDHTNGHVRKDVGNPAVQTPAPCPGARPLPPPDPFPPFTSDDR